MLQVTASASKIRFEPLPQDDPKQRRPDISKTQTTPRVGAESRPAYRVAAFFRIFRAAVQTTAADV